jgi:pSer/pThr/pTyr-binding forkhead associated (FHA) protein
MTGSFWEIVATHTEARWWYGLPAFALLSGALLVTLVAAVKIHRSPAPFAFAAACAIGAAVAFLLPSGLIALDPQTALGIAASPALPTATFAAVAQVLDRTMQLGFIGGGVLLVGALALTLGPRQRAACPNCQRELHPSWKGECPECWLMAPRAAESSLMRLGDVSASGVPITVLGVPAQTELLVGAATAGASVEIIRGASGVGERFAVGARLVIGRDPNQCQLVLDDESVSSRHAYIERTDQGFVVYDWGSRNGVRVNDQAVSQRALQHGDVITLGRSALRFCYADAPADVVPTQIFSCVPNARLVALGGARDGEIYPITEADIVLGRARHNTIVLDEPVVSRQHATIRFDGAGFVLSDCGSHNGTWLDDTRLLSPASLQSGQILRIGSQRLRFEQMEDTYATAP